MLNGDGPDAEEVVPEDAVVGPHAGEVVPEDAAMDEDAGKTKGTALPADTTDTSVSRAMRSLCNVEVRCPAKACLDLNTRLHVLQRKPEVGFVEGSKAAWLTFGNVTMRRNGRKLLPGVHGCERVRDLGRAISNKLALDITWVPVDCDHTKGTSPLLAISLRWNKGDLVPSVRGCERVHVLGRAISKGLALDIASVPLYYRHTNGTTPLLAPPP